mgnify:CR=1 FL=1
MLDLGRDLERAREALVRLSAEPHLEFGVRVPEGVRFDAAWLPDNVTTVVLPAGDDLGGWAGLRRVAQVTSIEEARAAQAAGVDGLIAKGSESGGRIGDETAFVLLQSLVQELSLPIWVQGGIGEYTAAACLAAGAAGVVLDSQLALFEECVLPDEVRRAVAAMDGSETVVVHGHRVYSRPGLHVTELGADELIQRLGGGSLGASVLPAGADAALAAGLARRYGSTARLITGLERRIDAHLALAARASVLDETSAFARRHGTGAAIAQGPMTRVSDHPDFAIAVSEAGGLPFLALAVMSGADSRRLLTEAASKLAGKTWGVGILGFISPELQEQQLSAIEEVRPPVALIAGGRPEQAAKLEALGTATYLHVPSPGLLDLFLRQGARRFVFEGQECGGHIGPRSSFVLWEQQLVRLMEFEHPEELSVLFAGGIHDARSAAAVSVLAAPLAAKGASVGVLMGTAYLFTNELVSTGALQPLFQQTAIDCDRTVLLETAPGHVTRCADTEYVRAFEAERERLVAAGLPKDEVWSALEDLNLGRLRIASKGIVRQGSELVTVDEATQRREGMVMLGQVAALERGRQSIRELHADVAERSFDLVRDAAGRSTDSGRPRDEDIAIVGMSVILPGASDVPTYWSNIVNGVNSVTEVPPDRWDPAIFYDSDSKTGEMTPSKWGGFIEPVEFDPLAYGIPPRSLAAIDPAQLLALEASQRALRDAGYDQRAFNRELASVIFGTDGGSELSAGYSFRPHWRQYVGEIPAELDEVLPSLTEDSFPGILGNVVAGRIANRLDLGGVNYTVDAACASSLAAVDLALKELRGGTSDLVICGAVDFHSGIVDYLSFSSVHALSPSGQCKTFDATADGIALGEGVAAVILKRLSDAERDGDRIYAVIKGVAGGSDGKSLGLTAPRQEGQVRTLRRVYERSGVSPAAVGLVEAHGTGTVVGDRTELETLNEVFRHAGAAPESCALGSVKSQIGHTKCAAGLAGIIKAALALHYQVLPPTLNVETPNPGWDPTSPFAINTEPRPWPGPERFAGVSAFGFGGTNFHAVLGSYDASGTPESSPGWPAELFLIRGVDQADARRTAETLRAAVSGQDGWRLADLARTVSTMPGAVQFAFVAADLDELRAKLADFGAGVFERPEQPLGVASEVAFLFPGQGSQKPGMLADLFVHFPSLQRYLELGERWRHIMIPPPAWSPQDAAMQKQVLTDTRNAQPALGIAGLATYDLLSGLGIEPSMLGGHSYGELVALCAAGAFSPRDLLALSEARAAAIAECIPDGGDAGSMAAAMSDLETLRGLLDGMPGVVIANQNAPDQNVLSGATDAVNAARKRLREAGVRTVELPVSSAFHSPIVAAAATRFEQVVAPVRMETPRRTVYSNTTAEPYPEEPTAIKQRLVEHIPAPVRFMHEILAMYEAGARIFVEAGPGQTLTGLVGRILGERPHVAIPVDQGSSTLTSFLGALAQLAVHGVEFEVERLFEGRDAAVVDLAQPPAGPKPTSWMVNGHLARPVTGDAPAHGMKPVTRPIAGLAATARSEGAAAPLPEAPAGLPQRTAPAPDAGLSMPPALADGDPRQAVLIEYLRSVRELADAQHQAVMAFLGQGSAPSEPARALNGHAPTSPHADAVTGSAPPRTSELPRNGHGPNGIAPDVPAVPVAARVEPVGLVAVAEPAVAASQRASIQTMLVSLVSQRTGYPAEMLDLDLDLEADLSIDSIKRVEIVGAMLEQLVHGDSPALNETPDELVRLKTLRAISTALEQTFGGVAAAPAPADVQGASVASVPAAAGTEGASTPSDLTTMLVTIVSERTGYPPEMLDLDLDLEADLSIDSIKRVEIVGAVLDGLASGGMDGFAETPDELVRLKTLRGIVAALETVFAPAAAAPLTNGHRPALSTNGHATAVAAPPTITTAGPDLMATLVQIVSERTGYPPEMLGADLDLEADLSIDSIKRIEILGALSEVAGLAATELPDEVVRIKTLRGIVAAFSQQPSTGGEADPRATAGLAAASQPALTDSMPGERPERYVLRFVATAGPPDEVPLTGLAVSVAAPDGPLQSALAEEIARLGGELATGDATGNAVVDLSALAPDWSPRQVYSTFERLRAALLEGAGRVIVATAEAPLLMGAADATRGAAGGVAGLVKSFAREWPERSIRVMHVEPGIEPGQLAAFVCAELGDQHGADEVVYTGGVRRVRRVVQRDLEPNVSPAVQLDAQSVILVVGGARGITSRVAVALANRYHCTLYLAGRTPRVADPLAGQLGSARDLAALRKALIELSAGEIRTIDARARSILAQREIVDTLAAVQAAGGTASYEELDARDAAALGGLIETIRRRHGRLDGIIHAAGLIEDRLVTDKTAESFERVYSTKVEPALALASGLAGGAQFVALFSSIAATFGGRGQADYAAANDVLDKVALAMNGQAGARWFAVDWGPWSGGGMISPELLEQYQRRGISVIDPEAGVRAFLDELRDGAREDAQVILMSGAPEAVSVAAKSTR